MEGTIAVITCFGASFAPKSWALCNGQILPINSNQALFAILGTTYGGDGVSNFALPDLRGRAPICEGQGTGLTGYNLGQKSGSETITLTTANLPAHNHSGPVNFTIQGDENDPTETSPDFGYPAKNNGAYAATPDAGTSMKAPAYTGTIGAAGGGLPTDIRSPYLAVNYIICTSGIFPSRN